MHPTWPCIRLSSCPKSALSGPSPCLTHVTLWARFLLNRVHATNSLSSICTSALCWATHYSRFRACSSFVVNWWLQLQYSYGVLQVYPQVTWCLFHTWLLAWAYLARGGPIFRCARLAFFRGARSIFSIPSAHGGHQLFWIRLLW